MTSLELDVNVGPRFTGTIAKTDQCIVGRNQPHNHKNNNRENDHGDSIHKALFLNNKIKSIDT